jgi:radical SAM superfamily enzyme YgiQ (UPF0313 family)
MNKLKVALIWPKGFDPKIVMPLSLGTLIANMDPSVADVKLINCSIDNMPAGSERLAEQIRQFSPDIIGISCWSFVWPEVQRLLHFVKSVSPKSATIVGGIHPTSCIQSILKTENKDLDFIMRGEAEHAFPEFLKQFAKLKPDWSKVKGLVYHDKTKKIVMNETERIDVLDTLKPVDYDIIRFEEYLKAGYRLDTSVKRNIPILTTRGCPYQCNYCAVSIMSGLKVRKHSIPYVINLIKKMYTEKHIRAFNIIDDNFSFDVEFAKSFCRAVIALGYNDIRFTTAQGVRMERGDPELWRLMKKAGWEHIGIAPESGSQRVLKLMHKSLDLEILPKIIRDIRAAGLKVHANFIIGYPGETLEDIYKTRDLIRRCRFNLVYLNNFQPYPGTPVYNQLLASGEIKDGLLPVNYSDGARPYTSRDLSGFNFQKFILSTYMGMAIRDPLNAIYMLRLFNIKLLIRKIYSNFTRMLKPKKRQRASKL